MGKHENANNHADQRLQELAKLREGIVHPDLFAAVAAGPLVHFRTSTDPDRLHPELVKIAQALDPARRVVTWTSATPATNLATGLPIFRQEVEDTVVRGVDPSTGAPTERPERVVRRLPVVTAEQVFRAFLDDPDPTILVLPNAHLIFPEGKERRALVDMFTAMWSQLRAKHKSIILQTPLAESLPPEIAELATGVSEKPTARTERKAIIERAVVDTGLPADAATKQAILDATTGLNATGTTSAVRFALAHRFEFGPDTADHIHRYKRESLAATGFWEPVSTDNVPELVGWESLFSQIARNRDYGVYDQGSPHNEQLLILLGQAGGGKTTAAKQIARMLGRQLVLGDPSKWMGSLMGQTEQRMKGAVDALYAAQPIVALVDEAQRVLQSNDQSTGGGTMNRSVQAMLTRIEEGRQRGEQVLWVFTGNTKDNMPPELMGRGAVWSVPFPGPQTRVKIFDTILGRFAQKDPRLIRDPGLSNSDVALMTQGYSGRDVEKWLSKAAVLGQGTISLRSLQLAQPYIVRQDIIDPEEIARRKNEFSRYPSVGDTEGEGTGTIFASPTINLPAQKSQPSLAPEAARPKKRRSNNPKIEVKID